MKNKAVLMDFWKAHQPDDSKIYKDKAWQQRDYFEKMGRVLEKVSGQEVEINVAGSHFSKSIELPVVEYRLANGASLTVRDNFYNFAVSVSSPREAVPRAMLRDIAGTDEPVFSGICEGFNQEKVFGSHRQNPRQFTTHIGDRDEFSYFLIGFGKLQNTGFDRKESPVLRGGFVP